MLVDKTGYGLMQNRHDVVISFSVLLRDEYVQGIELDRVGQEFGFIERLLITVLETAFRSQHPRACEIDLSGVH